MCTLVFTDATFKGRVICKNGGKGLELKVITEFEIN